MAYRARNFGPYEAATHPAAAPIRSHFQLIFTIPPFWKVRSPDVPGVGQVVSCPRVDPAPIPT
jgi:hypothetical protein